MAPGIPVRVLLVEDNPGDAMLVQEGLAEAPGGDFEVVEARTLAEAIAVARESHPDLALLDLSLPDCRGLETLERLRSAVPDLPVVVLTGLDDDRVGVASLQAGAQDFVVKDELTGRRLTRAVRLALERSRAERASRTWQDRYTEWIRHAVDGMFDWDLESNQTTYSPGWCAAYRLDPARVGSGPEEWLERIYVADATRVANELQAALDGTESTVSIDFRAQTSAGAVRWFRARLLVVRDRDGRAARLVGAQTDVTGEQTNPCTACGTDNAPAASMCAGCGARVDPARERSTAAARLQGAELVEGAVVGGRYRVDTLVAAGGSGAVYAATDLQSEARRALKVLHPWLIDSEHALERFAKEAAAQTRVEHPAIVRVYDTVADGQLAAIVMEYVAGPTLREFIVSSDASADPAALVDLFIPVIEGMAAAHALGIIHRDLKPENILVARVSDDSVALRVTDFGVAKLDGVESRTRNGAMLGTLHTMAPEQFVDARTADHRADIYALGCTLFELLTRRPPFVHETEFQMMAAHITELAPHPREFNPLVSPALSAAVHRALAKTPDDRYGTCTEFVAALRSAVG
ncbi:MAG: protein kinase [Myxococcales bacterium]|nr:protein kinase [Myxococcales bacterium]MCB9521063.1 protein kinase [Myxococcales bacterium]